MYFFVLTQTLFSYNSNKKGSFQRNKLCLMSDQQFQDQLEFYQSHKNRFQTIPTPTHSPIMVSDDDNFLNYEDIQLTRINSPSNDNTNDTDTIPLSTTLVISPPKPNLHLQALHQKQANQREQRKVVKSLKKRCESDFPTWERIIEIIDLMDGVYGQDPSTDARELALIQFIHHGVEYKFGVLINNILHPPELFIPETTVKIQSTKKSSYLRTDISFPTIVSEFCGWTQKRPHYYTLSQRNPQYSTDYVEDFGMLMVNYVFDVYMMLFQKIKSPNNPIKIRRYANNRLDDMDRVQKNMYRCMIEVDKKLNCQLENVLIPPEQESGGE